MASTKVISTTWAKKDLLKKLNDTLKRMDAEIVAWDKDQATIKKRQDVWDKKAEAWAKKNISKAIDLDFSTKGYKGPCATLFFDRSEFYDALGDRPDIDRKPDYKDTNYSKSVSDYEQLQNAIALIEGSTDTEFKINTTSVWASFIR